jgi:polysaccharide pyruvyl transferase WcaK-like protein
MGNLGNDAILTSMISNIRKRIGDAEIIGITLSPEDTERRHGIKGFPIAGADRTHYSPSNPRSSEAQPSLPTWLQRIKSFLKGISPLRKLVRTARVLVKDIAHILSAGRMVRQLDCVIITGGGALDEFWGGAWGHPWTLFKFAVLCRVQRVPFLFVSVGKCALERPLSRFFVRIALQLAKYRSYRDGQSKLGVQSILRSPDDPVVPDLAYSYPCPASLASPASRSMNGGQLVVGVSPIDYCDPRVWPLKDGRRYDRYLDRLGEMVTWLIQQGHRVVLFATDSPDVRTMDDLMARVSVAGSHAGAIEILEGPPEQTASGLLQNLEKVDLVIASRLHGVILSHILSKPVLAISYDPKVTTHMNDIRQQQYCLDIDELSADVLIERFHALRSASEQETATIVGAVESFRRQVDAQYDWLLERVRCGRGVYDGQPEMTTALQS